MLLVALALLSPRAARPCAMPQDYLRPSNYELVRDTPLIVRARSVKHIPHRSRSRRELPGPGTLRFRVLETLKGRGPRTLALPGHVKYKGANPAGELDRARPGATVPSCLALDYRLKAEWLLFLQRGEDGELQLMPLPGARVNEEVRGARDPWVKLVRAYVKVAARGYDDETTALRSLGEEARAAGDEALTRDVARYFASPYPSKATEVLLKLEADAKSPTERRRVLWALATGEHGAAEQRIRSLVDGEAWIIHTQPLARWLQRNGGTWALPLLFRSLTDRRLSRQRRALLSAIRSLAQEPQRPQMENLLTLLQEDEVSLVADWFLSHPSEVARTKLRQRMGGFPEEHPKLALALASLGEREILTWALAQPERKVDHKWLAYYVVARSPLDEADAFAAKVIATPPHDGIAALVQGYGEANHPRVWTRLAEALALKKKPGKLEHWLRVSLERLAKRAPGKAKELLKKLGD